MSKSKPISKKEYIFPAHYEEQLKSLLGHSLAFNIFSVALISPSNDMPIREITIKVSESRLPRYCNPELVEHAFASLEKNPENLCLLETLGNYTRNNLFERIAVGLADILSIIVCTSTVMAISLLFVFALTALQIAMLAPGATMILITLGFFAFVPCLALPIIFVAEVVSPIIEHLALKIGRWIGEFVKGVKQLDTLQVLDEKLNELISEQAKTSAREERTGEVFDVSDKAITHNVDPVKETNLYPSLEGLDSPASETITEPTRTIIKRCSSLSIFPTNHANLSAQDTTNNTGDSAQTVPKNMFNIK